MLLNKSGISTKQELETEQSSNTHLNHMNACERHAEPSLTGNSVDHGLQQADGVVQGELGVRNVVREWQRGAGEVGLEQ